MLSHTREQGFRVHHLTNLGGLVALAGLDLESPDLLLGALLQMAGVLANCSADQRQVLALRGHRRLDQRATGKRAWKSGARAQDLQSINLTASQIEKLIEALAGRVPSEPARLPLVLSQLLSATCDGAA
jgi:conjugative transfer protein TraD